MSVEWNKNLIDRAEVNMWKRHEENRKAVDQMFEKNDALVAFRLKAAKSERRKQKLDEFLCMSIVVITVSIMIWLARIS